MYFVLNIFLKAQEGIRFYIFSQIFTSLKADRGIRVHYDLFSRGFLFAFYKPFCFGICSSTKQPRKDFRTWQDFDIKKAKDGRYVFNLYNANHIIIATSQIYSSSQSAVNGVKSVMTNATKAALEDSTLKNPVPQPFPKWEVYIDKAGEYRFRLYATNGSCICHAKAGYATKSNCKRGIDSIIRLAEAAQIDKSYLVKKQEQ